MDRRLLNSWKEISSYLGRGVRTVQRYEIQFALPVHRPAGVSRSSVIAFSDELDRWLQASPTRSQQFNASAELVVPKISPRDNRPSHDGSEPCPLCHGTGTVSTDSVGKTQLSLAPKRPQKAVSA